MRAGGGIARGSSRSGSRLRGVLAKVAARAGHQGQRGYAMRSDSTPGVRYVDGKPYYSAAWLNRPLERDLPH
jgi:hypothetical protein